ncbi:hypothetical protein LEP1GSC193_1129 [Leptospira alstonii serovar Pingchang str. 80-412]|uniref:Uncharacterized protein n=2 Tax=Leptospira alstonii TaxID=28452 RepID=M6D727_9LEPT|nr:hypothetical protein LEP1GSC194_2842 [Leptospira alstonii serovar Sichuan str. 79601]EQA82527.1 hypothetical protein LEP1GSC193_1129 [Leptospira alstonii serovar Pingchang str. 80-412]
MGQVLFIEFLFFQTSKNSNILNLERFQFNSHEPVVFLEDVPVLGQSARLKIKKLIFVDPRYGDFVVEDPF